MPQSPLGPYQIDAFNTAKDSDNKIHDDAVARRFGFSGGLVPGVEVYAYMTHLPAARWGRAWLEHGAAECRLLKPVYDGDRVTVSASETADGLELRTRQPRRAVRHRPRLAGRQGIAGAGDLRRSPGAAEPARRPAAGRRDDARGRHLVRDPPVPGRRPRPPGNISSMCARACRSMPPKGWCIPGPSCTSAIGRCGTMSSWGRGCMSAAGSSISPRPGSATSFRPRLSSPAITSKKGHRFVDLDVLVYANGTHAGRPHRPYLDLPPAPARRRLRSTANYEFGDPGGGGAGAGISRVSTWSGGVPKRRRMRYFCQSRR